MSKIIQFGEQVEGYNVPVLNEREIRGAAGILFVLMLVSIMLAGLTNEFFLIKYAVTIFLADMLIRVLINPKFSPSLILGRLAVRNQTPEYVGAPQKKFAWIIGVILAATIFTLLVVYNSVSPITGIICMICLLFLFFETAFGICLGCMFYPLFFKEQVEHCAGDVCTKDNKTDMQKTSLGQLVVVLGFVAFIAITVVLFKDYFSLMPYDTYGILESSR